MLRACVSVIFQNGGGETATVFAGSDPTASQDTFGYPFLETSVLEQLLSFPPPGHPHHFFTMSA